MQTSPRHVRLAFVLIQGVFAGLAGCGSRDADPPRTETEAGPPRLGDAARADEPPAELHAATASAASPASPASDAAAQDTVAHDAQDAVAHAPAEAVKPAAKQTPPPTLGGEECAVELLGPSTGSVLPSERLAKSADERTALDAELSFIDPTLDGFDTELLNASGGKILSALAVGLTGEIPAEVLEEHVSPDFRCSGLKPATFEDRWVADGLAIRTGGAAPEQYEGRAGLSRAFADLGAAFAHDESAADHADAGHHELHTKFKIVKIETVSPTQSTTGLIYLATGLGTDGLVQQDAQWSVLWDTSQGFDRPRLLGLEVRDFSETSSTHELFTDCTASAFRDAEELERVRHGIHSWWGRIDTGMGFSLYGDYALNLVDVDEDGLEDVYVCQPGSMPNMLLRHEADGTLTDISAGSGLDYLDDTPTAVFADFDNDGHQDVALATLLSVDFLKGDGKGHFTLVALDPTDNGVSISAADYDNDGLLDLYVCRYSTANRGTGAGDTIYDSNDGKPNVLLKNEGGFRFRDATAESGLDHNNHKFSFSGVWEDYDDDGDLDLYVANDFGRNNLYRNDAGHFRDVAAEAGVEDMAAGMGVTWGDYDLDGRVDLYVSNMFSSAGGRIVDKPRISEIAGGDAVAPLARFAKGNTLLRNRGDGTFEDASYTAGVTMGRWSWGGEFVDVNNDAWLDLMVPNGFVTNAIASDL